MPKQKKSVGSRIISTMIVVVILIVSYMVYEHFNFNEFTKAEYVRGVSKFTRDSDIKYGEADSYKIENPDFNDAVFYQTIEVEPNTAYKVSCMIKTENVENKNANTDVGAHISIAGTTEKSNNVTGTTDWQKVEFLFQSKDRTEVTIQFRLGGYADNSKGTAWFSDFKVVSGIADTSSTWNYLCLLFNQTKVNVENKNLDLQLTAIDVDDMKQCMQRFQNSMQELSNNQMRVNYDIMQVSTPITHLSYDETNGYYLAASDIADIIDPYIQEGKYDHIFACFRTGDLNQHVENAGNDWIGLGGMEYRNIGYSNIRLPDDDSSYIYKYDYRANTFPEEVFVHEFLHTLERNAEEYGYTIPALHDNGNYGYESQRLVGLKDWYQDYMNQNIQANGTKIGLPTEIYTKKPVKQTDFEFSHQLNVMQEPDNIIEEMKIMIERMVKFFNNKQIENNVE